MTETDISRLLRLKQIIGDPRSDTRIEPNYTGVQIKLVGGCEVWSLSKSH